MPADNLIFESDPAAVFAAATSLWQACHQREANDPALNLAAAYQGMDELMRVVMRVAEYFEAWACRHVVFTHIDATWSYLLIDRFGAACLKAIPPTALSTFNSVACLCVSFHLRLPLRADGSLPLPVDVRASHPAPNSGFAELRIQSVRDELASDQTIPFTEDQDPFDTAMGPPYFALYGRSNNDLWEHIADRKSYSEARLLALKLVPNLEIPITPVCFGR